MVEIGGKPILWHIMKIYIAHGVNDFVICLGYKGYVIKEYFANYFLAHVGRHVRHDKTIAWRSTTPTAEPWRVTLVDTGEKTMIGGRIKRILPYLGDDKEFCLTYGDGVGDVDITRRRSTSIDKEGRLATVTAGSRPAASARSSIKGTRVTGFHEKPRRRRRLDQRRLFRARPEGRRLHRGRRDGLGARADGTAGRRGPASAFISTTASGSRWTRCATSVISKTCGPPARRRGRSGKERQQCGF